MLEALGEIEEVTAPESGLRNGGLGVESLGDDVELGFQQAL